MYNVQVIYYIILMFPIKDHNPSYKTPIITYIIIMLCSAAWLYELSLWNSLDAFFQEWALQPAEIIAWESIHTLFTSMFLHGGWMHIIWNMLFLYIFWDNLEARMGHFKFILFYLLSWLVASALQIYSDPTSLIPNIGASGAIAWVMWGYLLLYPKAKVDTIIMLWVAMKKITLPAFFMLGYWFATQVFSWVWTIWDVSTWGVAFWAHVWGFVAWLILVIPYKFSSTSKKKKKNRKKVVNHT